MSWPISWPASVDAPALDANLKRLCELYASACMTALTLHRVGGDPVTIMPAARVSGYWLHTGVLEGTVLGRFYPFTLYPSAADLQAGAYAVGEIEALELPGPVGAVTEVMVGGAVLPASAYRVEDGRYLVRLDGGSWPASGEGFTVTYHNTYPVDEMGAHAGGVMANEWLKLFSRNSKDKCRLPSTATSISRGGISMEIATGMFPEGVTGLPEIDAYLMLFNPFGLRVAPRVYSPDLPRHRQVWHA